MSTIPATITVSSPLDKKVKISVQFSTVTEFFNRSNGTVMDRMSKMIFIEFSNFILQNTHIRDKNYADAIAVRAAQELFSDHRFLTNPRIAKEIAVEKLLQHVDYYTCDVRHQLEIHRLLKLLPKINEHRFLKN